MSDDDRPVRLRSNEHWGKRAGAMTEKFDSKYRIDPGQRVIRQVSGAFKHQEHSGPHGRQLRFYPGRALRKKLGKHGLRRGG